jgi:vacuolar-type H+-ATPase subunit H
MQENKKDRVIEDLSKDVDKIIVDAKKENYKIIKMH